jgi:hypothetical protein
MFRLEGADFDIDGDEAVQPKIEQEIDVQS